MKLTMVEVFTPCKLTNATNQDFFKIETAYQHTIGLSNLLSYKISKTELLLLRIIWDI